MKKVFVLFVFLLVSACTSPTPVTNENANPAPAVANAPTPTSDPAMSQLRGQMLVKGEPVTTGILYLSELIKDNTGKEVVASFSRESRLRGDFDEYGNFVVWNVPPGRYGVVYDLVSTAFLLTFPDREDSLIVTVTGGDDQDLGVLDYPSYPNSTD